MSIFDPFVRRPHETPKKAGSDKETYNARYGVRKIH
jgi:hypothetical protein